MRKIQARLCATETQQGVFLHLLAIQTRVGAIQVFFQDGQQRINRYGSGDARFSVRRPSYCSSLLETVQLVQKDKYLKQHRGANPTG